MGRGRVNREGERRWFISFILIWIWWMYFVYMYENRTMEPVETVLRRAGRGMCENDEGVNLTKICSKHIRKCHNVTMKPPHTTNIC
jgi:hypothetical protein